MEPVIAYLIDDKKWKRHHAVIVCGVGVFLVGLPSALSTSLFKDTLLFGNTFLDLISFVASSILIPLGGFCAVILVGWIWGVDRALAQIKLGAYDLFERKPWLEKYFWFCFKLSAPILIIVVFLNALGLFGLTK